MMSSETHCSTDLLFAVFICLLEALLVIILSVSPSHVHWLLLLLQVLRHLSTQGIPLISSTHGRSYETTSRFLRNLKKVSKLYNVMHVQCLYTLHTTATTLAPFHLSYIKKQVNIWGGGGGGRLTDTYVNWFINASKVLN